MRNDSVTFFETQFQRQLREHDFALNPFESMVLDHLEGDILDIGCGLGNLALEAARRNHTVLAVDASASAIQHIRAQAATEHLPIHAIETDIGSWRIAGLFDTVVSIGLLMFFAKPRALELLHNIQSAVRPGGRAAVNVLIEGTTYMDMFAANHYYLFGKEELEQRFHDWRIILSRFDTRPAPGGTSKVFATVIAEKPTSSR